MILGMIHMHTHTYIGTYVHTDTHRDTHKHCHNTVLSRYRHQLNGLVRLRDTKSQDNFISLSLCKRVKQTYRHTEETEKAF